MVKYTAFNRQLLMHYMTTDFMTWISFVYKLMPIYYTVLLVVYTWPYQRTLCNVYTITQYPKIP